MTVDSAIQKVHALLLDNLPAGTTRSPKGWTIFNCVMCNDKRKRAGIKTTAGKISYNCFNDPNCKTGWEPSAHLGKKYKALASRLGATDKEIHDVQLELLKYSNELANEDEFEYNGTFSKFELKEFPEDTVVKVVADLPDDHPVKQYAKDRGLLGHYNYLYFDGPVKYRKRLIIPFTYNNELVGWTGRHISPPNKQTPKYLHEFPTGYVFNLDRFSNSEREIMIVTEGVFDAILVDGVSVLSNQVSPEQLALIEKLNKKVILCPDRDAPGKELTEQAIDLGWSVSFPPWHKDCKDAADAVSQYGRLLTVASIIKHATDNKTKIKVKTKLNI